MDMITKMLGKKIGECIADGHKMVYDSHSKIGFAGYPHHPSATMYFLCSRCGYKADRNATEKEVDAIRTISNAKYKED